jgi:hypothetical protein
LVAMVTALRIANWRTKGVTNGLGNRHSQMAIKEVNSHSAQTPAAAWMIRSRRGQQRVGPDCPCTWQERIRQNCPHRPTGPDVQR